MHVRRLAVSTPPALVCLALALSGCGLLDSLTGTGSKDDGGSTTPPLPFTLVESFHPGPEGVAQMAGTATHLFVATRKGVLVYDATKPLANGPVARIDGVEITAVRVRGNRLYAGSAYVSIHDITDPVHPVSMGMVGNVAVNQKELVVDDQYAYVGTANFGVKRFPLPGVTGTTDGFNANGEVNALAGNGKALYVANLTEHAVRGYDVTKAPPDVSKAVVTFTPQVLQGSGDLFPWGLLADGNRLYVTGNGQLQIYDITNPAMPTSIVKSEIGGSGSTTRQDIALDGNWLVTEGQLGPVYWDLSDPSTLHSREDINQLVLTPIVSIAFAGGRLYYSDNTLTQVFAPR